MSRTKLAAVVPIVALLVLGGAAAVRLTRGPESAASEPVDAAWATAPEPGPPPRPPLSTPVTSATDAGAEPAGSRGRCRLPVPADAGNCTDVLDQVRGDGATRGTKLPAVKPSVMPEWDLDGLRDHACAFACAPPGSAAHLLAWSVIEDDRPLRNHNAVFAIEHATVPPEVKWSVVITYRHATNASWNVNVSFHRAAKPIRDFSRRPTDADIVAMLDENGWQWAREAHGFQLLAGNVIDPLWLLVTKQAPSRFFPRDIER